MDRKTTVCLPKDLSEGEVAGCLEVLKEGKAVDLDSAAAELPHALRVAVVRVGTVVVAVMAIKRPRPGYAGGIAKKSGFAFPARLPELGYAAVREDHQGHNLGGDMMREILKSFGKQALFATTSHGAMKKHLARAGFESFGKPWAGNCGELTLWLLYVR